MMCNRMYKLDKLSIIEHALFHQCFEKDIGLYNLLFCENHVLLTGSSCLSLPFIPIYMDDGGTGFANRNIKFEAID